MAAQRVSRRAHSRGRRIGAVIAALSMLPAFMVALAAPEPARAAVPSPSYFDPGNIITDANFYNNNAMTEAEIQAFLVQRGSVLANYKSSVASRPVYETSPGYIYCHAFQGGNDLLASTIIFRVQEACGISAKVILVTLQKEQGLITRSSAPASAFRIAMGYGCPDTAPCEEQYYGFGNQVYRASWQFNAYRNPANGFYHRPGNIHVRYHPNVACGGKVINIKNWATAALYSYTPYQPNTAALNSFPGTGDGCSSYGNRNFWFFYFDWFGSPTALYPQDVAVERLGGGSRFVTAADISRDTHETADVVYVANGRDFPDALSSAPAAASADAPLLLVEADEVPHATLTELQRLQPTEIVVVGGEGVVSAGVLETLSTLAPSVRRVDGSNRYGTSRAVAQDAFGSGASAVFIATGRNYPDALAAGAAAGHIGAPVILVDGDSPVIDSATSDLITALGATTVYIAGGTAVVSPGIETALKNVAGVTEVTRFGAGSRYAVSGQINRAFFSSTDVVYFAAGTDFADALAGASAAGSVGAPLYLTPSTCIYTHMLEDVVTFDAATVKLLGGTGVLTPAVERFANCT